MRRTRERLRHPRKAAPLAAGALCAALLLLAGCRCAEGPLTTLEPGFRVAPETRALDFGRVLEGSTVTRSIVVVSETQVSVRVAARTGSPFFVPEAVEIAGGASAELPVAFLAGAALATEVVTLTANDVDVEVPVRGTGVRPLDCQPSAECRVASYFFEEHRCVEAFAAEDTPCNTGSECLERGRCREGACVGVARSCDDGDACTVDACSPTAGCVLSAVQCPRPSNPCQLPTCDWQTGCGQRSAPDLTVCGPVDCTSASVCSGGACITVPTPEGWACAPPVLCYGRGECHAQRCVRTDAGASWAPSWSTPFAGKVVTEGAGLLAHRGSLFFVVCGLAPEASGPGPGDGDAGAEGGGDDDGGAGVGTDGGACRLASYTTSGFERFGEPLDELLSQSLVSVGARGVVLRGDGGLELRSASTGARLEVLSGLGSVAFTADDSLQGGRSLADGGVELLVSLADGGVQLEPVPWAAEAVLALDEAERLWAFEPGLGRLSRRTRDADGGWQDEATPVPPALPTLAVSGRTALLGGSVLVTWPSDGGPPLTAALVELDAGAHELLAREQLLGLGAAVAFHRRCDDTSGGCGADAGGGLVTVLRVFDAEQGTLAWEAALEADGGRATLVDATLVDFQAGTTVALVRVDGKSGASARVQVFVRGAGSLACAIPPAAGLPRTALFTPGRLLVVADAPDGGALLQAWPLDGLPLLQRAWPAFEGLGGLRRAAP